MEQIQVQLVLFDEVTTQPGGESRSDPDPTMSSHNKQHRNPQKSRQTLVVFENLTSLVHVSILLFFALILFLCFLGEFVFFTWHPLLLSLGWMLLMSEGILSLSPHNILMGYIPRGFRVRLHVILHSLALFCSTTGFAIVYLNKDHLNKHHFTTWHGLFGLIGTIGNIVTCLLGAATWYKAELRNYIKPKVSKFLHYGCGICTYWFGGLSLILSVYTKWFERQTGSSYIIFAFGLILVATTVVWTLVKPSQSFFRKIRKSINASS